MQLKEQIKTFILAGGTGTRLYPLSSATMPKQFLKLFSDSSLFQQTVLRNLHIGSPVIMVSKDYLEIVKIQLEEIGISSDYSEIEIIVEPLRRNTAASAVLAAHYAQKHGVEKMIIVPCDHIIDNQLKYEETVEKAVSTLDNSQIVAIAIKPDHFSSEYGYIESVKTSKDTYEVKSFIEKPQTQPNGLFSSDKYYFWNSGIYLVNADYILQQASTHWQFFEKMIQTAFEAATIDGNIFYTSGRFYQHVENASFDVVFSEKVASKSPSDMQIVEARFNWSDMGSWPVIIKKIISTYPVNSRIKHDNIKNSHNHSTQKIFDLEPGEIYDFAPKILVLEDIIAIIHGEHLSIAARNEPEKVIAMKKEEFLIKRHSIEFIEQFRIAS